MKKQSIKGILFSIILVEVLGFISSKASGDIRMVYDALLKPPLSPPGWLFGVAWVILYALMGISVYLIYTDTESADRKEALQLFGWQLVLNLIWPIFFFRWGLYQAAVVVILILDFLVWVMIKKFARINETAARLLIPYGLWLLYATYLNIGFALLNR